MCSKRAFSYDNRQKDRSIKLAHVSFNPFVHFFCCCCCCCSFGYVIGGFFFQFVFDILICASQPQILVAKSRAPVSMNFFLKFVEKKPFILCTLLERSRAMLLWQRMKPTTFYHNNMMNLIFIEILLRFFVFGFSI